MVSTVQMRDTLGFEPKYTTAEAFAEFVRGRGPGLLPPQALAGAVDRIAALPFLGGARSGPSHPTQSAN
jgi:UDP-glucose 4-epimerase